MERIRRDARQTRRKEGLLFREKEAKSFCSPAEFAPALVPQAYRLAEWWKLWGKPGRKSFLVLFLEKGLLSYFLMHPPGTRRVPPIDKLHQFRHMLRQLCSAAWCDLSGR